MASAGERAICSVRGLIMITTHWLPWVNTIKDPTVVPIAHYTDPTQMYDAWSGDRDQSGEWIKTACGAGFAPVLPNDHHWMCPDCEAKRTPASVLVMGDAAWGARNGL